VLAEDVGGCVINRAHADGLLLRQRADTEGGGKGSLEGVGVDVHNVGCRDRPLTGCEGSRKKQVDSLGVAVGCANIQDGAGTRAHEA
jgi:hypothetical protein